jgi:hypothetical protein
MRHPGNIFSCDYNECEEIEPEHEDSEWAHVSAYGRGYRLSISADLCPQHAPETLEHLRSRLDLACERGAVGQIAFPTGVSSYDN